MSAFSNLRSSILVHITKTNAAISILQQGRMRVGKNDPSWKKNQLQMLGEGVYSGRSYSICLGKVRKLIQSEGVATVVSIVNLGEIYETKRRQHYLSGKLLQSNGLNFHSTRCLGKNIATGTEYCIYDPERIIPLFAWIQAQNDEYFLVRSDDGIYRYDEFPVNKLIIQMNNECILLSDGNNLPHKEPLLGKRTIIFYHLYDFYFGKIIQRNINIDSSKTSILIECICETYQFP